MSTRASFPATARDLDWAAVTSIGVGVVLPMEGLSGRELVPFARHAEGVGLDSVWAFDHFFANLPGEPHIPTLEAWTTVSAVAATTERVEIGQLVMCVSYRSPGMLAKMAATADAVSGGRITLGLGAGWHTEEYEAFGYPFDERVDAFEEALQIIRPLVNGQTVTFAGRHHRAKGAVLLPFERPIPILVAAKGPRMLRLTARYADAWNTAWFGHPDEEVRRRLADLDAALEAEGRDPSTLRRTVGVDVRDRELQPDGEAVEIDELPAVVEAYADLGFADLILGFERMTRGSLDRIATSLGLSAP